MAATNDHFNWGLFGGSFSRINQLVVWPVKCRPVFPNTQDDILERPVLSTNKRYSVYRYEEVKKPGNIHMKEAELENFDLFF